MHRISGPQTAPSTGAPRRVREKSRIARLSWISAIPARRVYAFGVAQWREWRAGGDARGAGRGGAGWQVARWRVDGATGGVSRERHPRTAARARSRSNSGSRSPTTLWRLRLHRDRELAPGHRDWGDARGGPEADRRAQLGCARAGVVGRSARRTGGWRRGCRPSARGSGRARGSVGHRATGEPRRRSRPDRRRCRRRWRGAARVPERAAPRRRARPRPFRAVAGSGRRRLRGRRGPCPPQRPARTRATVARAIVRRGTGRDRRPARAGARGPRRPRGSTRADRSPQRVRRRRHRDRIRAALAGIARGLQLDRRLSLVVDLGAYPAERGCRIEQAPHARRDRRAATPVPASCATCAPGAPGRRSAWSAARQRRLARRPAADSQAQAIRHGWRIARAPPGRGTGRSMPTRRKSPMSPQRISPPQTVPSVP